MFMDAVGIIISIFAAFFSSGLLLGLKWFYSHMKGNQEFREDIIKQTTIYLGEVKNLKEGVLMGNERMTEMFAEELHPLSAKVKRLKKGLNIVEDRVNINRTSFDDLTLE